MNIRKTVAGVAVAVSGVTAAVVVAHPASAAPARPAAAQHQTLPAWFHWTYATRAATKAECGHAAPRAIIAWQGDSDQSYLFCASGKVSLPD